MKYLLTALMLCAVAAHAQLPFEKQYRDCTSDSACYYCGDVAAYYKRNLADKMKFSIEHAAIKWMGTSGSMLFEVQVDEKGHSCVRSVKDMVHMADVKDVIRRCINNLWDWIPAQSNGRAIASTVIIELNFVGNDVLVKFIKPRDIH